MKNKLREILKELTVIPPLGHFTFYSDRERYIADKIEDVLTEIISLAKECAPEEKKIIEWDEDCTSTGNADDAYDHGMERGEIFGFNAGVKQFLANIEGELTTTQEG